MMKYMIHASRALLIAAELISSCGPSSADVINRFAGRSSEKVRADTTDPESYLTGNLKTNTVQAIPAEFVKRYPGATAPYSRD